MNRFKQWLMDWDSTRIFRIVLGVTLLIAYFSTKDQIYLIGGILFSTQALLNMGCVGNTCKSGVPQKKGTEIIKTEELKTGK